MTETTVTKTRTEIDVQEVEETLYVCTNCEQQYEKDEMLTVLVDVGPGRYTYEDMDQRQLCGQCADTVLDYTPTDSFSDYVGHHVRHWEPRDWLYAVASALLPPALLGTILAVVLPFGMKVAENAAGSMTTTTASETASGVTDLIIPVMLAAFIFAIASAVVSGGTR